MNRHHVLTAPQTMRTFASSRLRMRYFQNNWHEPRLPGIVRGAVLAAGIFLALLVHVAAHAQATTTTDATRDTTVDSSQPDANFGRILAAYGGVFVACSLLWGVVMDGFRPDR